MNVGEVWRIENVGELTFVVLDHSYDESVLHVLICNDYYRYKSGQIMWWYISSSWITKCRKIA